MSASYLVPVLLVIGELLEFTRNSRVLGQVDVTLELEDALRRVGVQGLFVIQNIPGAGRAVLWVTGPRRVDESLLRGCMRSD